MAKFVEVDVRGLSCPEPVLLTMDAMEDHPGEMIRVLGDEAHTRKNIEKMLEYEHKDGQTTTRADGRYENKKALSGFDILHYFCGHGTGSLLQTERDSRQADPCSAGTFCWLRDRMADGTGCVPAAFRPACRVPC